LSDGPSPAGPAGDGQPAAGPVAAAGPEAASGPGGEPGPQRRSWKRRAVRISLVAGAAVAMLVAGVAACGYALVNHLADNIHRIPSADAALDAADQPVMPAATRHSMTILLNGSQRVPVAIRGQGVPGSTMAPQEMSGLLALVHINVGGQAGAVVSIPVNALAYVPGYGVTELWNSMPLGGPSLLIEAVEQLTGVRIDHYTVVDFDGLAGSLGPLGGVDVVVPQTTSSNGAVFPRGINHLTSATALDYVRQVSLSQDGQILRQQALLRAILQKLDRLHLLTDPAGGFSVLNAVTKALSVDSNFTNTGLVSLVTGLRLLGSPAATYVAAPVGRSFVFEGQRAVSLNQRVSHRLWQAVRHDAVAAFARRYPSTVTPIAPH
jgi:LCP family protein required for cell wall assembly